MIRRFRLVPDSARRRAAQRVMEHYADPFAPDPVDLADDGDDLALEDEILAMEQVWAMAGAVAQDPRIMAAREEDLARYAPRKHWRPVALVAAMLVVMIVGAATLLLRDPGDGAPQQIAASNFSTGVAERSQVVLADRSNVTLDADSAITVQISDRERNVSLQRGRALFEVAKDRSRPFLVRAGNKQVRATGTAFSVELRDDEVIVIVTEGTVEVTELPRPRARASAPPHSAEMKAGTQLVAHNDTDWSVAAIDPLQATSWRVGRLQFNGNPLSEAVAEMNRYSRQKLVFRDDRIPNDHIVGVFKAGDTLGFAQAIELGGFVRIVETTPDHIEVEAVSRD